MWKMMSAAVVGLTVAGHAFGDIMTQFQGNTAHTGAVADSVGQSSLAPVWTVTAASLGVQSLVPGVVGDGTNVYFTANVTLGGGFLLRITPFMP